MKRLNLAFVTPLNPIPNGLSDYSELLLPALAEQADITLYSECGTPTNPQIADRFEVRPVRQLLRHHAEHDLRLYQIGNSPDHAAALEMLRCLPGIVVLHEPFLHHGLRGVSGLRHWRELAYELGPVKREFLHRWAVENDRVELASAPVIRRIVDSSLGLIVHSEAARHLILDSQSRNGGNRSPEIAVIPHLMPILPTYDRLACRDQLGLPQEAVVFGVPGTVDPTKEPALILHAFAQVRDQLPTARLAFAGDRPADYGLDQLVRELNLPDRVHFLGRVEPLEQLHQAIAACDAVINLRQPTIGETSGTALRALSLGRALIVRNVGWYGELPNEACVKIGAQSQADELARAMLAVANSPAYRLQLEQAGRSYIQTACDPAAVARQYSDFGCDLFHRIISLDRVSSPLARHSLMLMSERKI
ncbi:MAG: glycosyltransferase family 4 protein [Anaerolineae bacterium]